MSLSNRLPVGVLLSYAGMLAASCMTWGRVPTDDQMSPGLRSMLLFPMHEGSMAITAWNTDINLCGVLVPNWGPLVAGLFLVGFLILRAFELWMAPKLVTIGLVTYGSVHLVTLTAMIMDHGDIGAGSLLSCGCFLVLSVISLWLMVVDLRQQLAQARVTRAGMTSRRASYPR